MGLKDFFINDESGDKKPEVKKEAPVYMPSSLTPASTAAVQTSMPTEMPSTLNTQTFDSSALNKVVESVTQTYNNGFISLNREGYDFFEYYQAIKSINGTTTDQYKMAFTMGKSMNPSITPESLVSDSQYYIAEIQKVYNQYESSGMKKAKEAEEDKTKRKESLNFQIISLKQQISTLQAELENKTNELNGNDSPFDSALNDINLKLEANKIAGNNLISSLQEVSTNIKNYLQ